MSLVHHWSVSSFARITLQNKFAPQFCMCNSKTICACSSSLNRLNSSSSLYRPLCTNYNLACLSDQTSLSAYLSPRTDNNIFRWHKPALCGVKIASRSSIHWRSRTKAKQFSFQLVYMNVLPLPQWEFNWIFTFSLKRAQHHISIWLYFLYFYSLTRPVHIIYFENIRFNLIASLIVQISCMLVLHQSIHDCSHN